MQSVRRSNPRLKTASTDTPPRLPLRWALIIMAALGAGFAVTALAGLAAGVSVGIALAGLLHTVLD